MQETIDLLLQKNIKPSFTRIRILDYLKSNNSHPTVDDIYSDLVKELPTLSKTTVYNTLELYKERRIVKTLTLKNHQNYDFIREEHAHFHCQKCNKIVDIEMEIPKYRASDKSIHSIVDAELTYHGICEDCQSL